MDFREKIREEQFRDKLQVVNTVYVDALGEIRKLLDKPIEKSVFDEFEPENDIEKSEGKYGTGKKQQMVTVTRGGKTFQQMREVGTKQAAPNWMADKEDAGGPMRAEASGGRDLDKEDAENRKKLQAFLDEYKYDKMPRHHNGRSAVVVETEFANDKGRTHFGVQFWEDGGKDMQNGYGTNTDGSISHYVQNLPPREERHTDPETGVKSETFSIKSDLDLSRAKTLLASHKEGMANQSSSTGEPQKERANNWTKAVIGKLEAAISEYEGSHKKKVKLDPYHNSYTSAINNALEYAEGQGYTYDKEETATKIGAGPRKPDEGDTNRFSITLYKDDKEQKKALQIQVYGMRDKYELNAYIS